jgi:antitoxin VapB
METAMNMQNNKTFRTKPIRDANGQAIHLPEDMAFPDGQDVIVVKSGERISVYPAPKMTMQELIAKLRSMPKPSEIEVRDTEEIPEREGL